MFDAPIVASGPDPSEGTRPPRPPGGRATASVEPTRVSLTAAQLPAVDLCAGWASDSAMMDAIRATGVIPTPMGPVAPMLERTDDPESWHVMDPLGPHAMRRRRRLELAADHGSGATHHLDVALP